MRGCWRGCCLAYQYLQIFELVAQPSVYVSFRVCSHGYRLCLFWNDDVEVQSIPFHNPVRFYCFPVVRGIQNLVVGPAFVDFVHGEEHFNEFRFAVPFAQVEVEAEVVLPAAECILKWIADLRGDVC